jgi:hypothetical protein
VRVRRDKYTYRSPHPHPQFNEGYKTRMLETCQKKVDVNLEGAARKHPCGKNRKKIKGNKNF